MDHRHGLAVGGPVTSRRQRRAERGRRAGGGGDWPGARQSRRIRPTTRASSWPCQRALGVTPHVAQNTTHRRRAIDARTTPSGLCAQPARTQTGRRDLRLAQDGRPAAPEHATVGAPASPGCLSSGSRRTTCSGSEISPGWRRDRAPGTSSSGHAKLSKRALWQRKLTWQTTIRLLCRRFSIAC